jgi:hypothetical protein
MSTSRPRNPLEPNRDSEAARLLTEIRTLTVELAELRRKTAADEELHQKEGAIERLRWRLAATARRAATDELGNAA